MTEHTKEEIMKALECCQTQYNRNCKECPYAKYKTHYISAVTCSSRMRSDLLDLINRQKAEIERLTAMVEAAEDYLNPLPFKNAYNEAIEKSKAEAIKEFAEKLKEKIRVMDRIIIYGEDIDNLAKEMTEGKE